MKVKKAIYAVVTAVFVVFMLLFSGIGSLARISAPTIELKGDNNSTIEAPGLSFVSVPLAAGDSVVGVERVTATVTPAGTPIEWSLSWENSGDGRPMSEYLTIQTVSSNSIDLTCLQRFSGTAILRCAFVHDPSIYDTVSVTAEPEKTGTDLSQMTVGVFSFSNTGDSGYESEVSQVISEMEFVAGSVEPYTMRMNSLSSAENAIESGGVDVAILYDYNDMFLNGISDSVFENTTIWVIFANISTGTMRESDLSGYQNIGFLYGMPSYDDLVSMSETGMAISDADTLILYDNSGCVSLEWVTAILDMDGVYYDIIEYDDPGSISWDYDPGNYGTIVMTDSRTAEYIADMIGTSNIFIAHSDGSEDYGTLFPDGNYKAFTMDLDVSLISEFASAFVLGEVSGGAPCKIMNML